MIISSNCTSQNNQFEAILTDSQLILEKKNKADPIYFSKRTPTEFEVDVHDAMCTASVGTPFEGTLKLVSGHRFPDIVIDNYYGVEVKTAKNNWKSTGNSVLESTRVDGVKRIYLFFAILSSPADFKFRKYEECLYEVAVTHSPRYLIDMELAKGKSIFDKMKISYNDLRILDKPIKPFVDYYRAIAKPGEEPWWMEGSGVEEEAMLKPMVSLLNNLSSDEQDELRNQAMALFPEIFGTSLSKYQKLALWLVAKKGVLAPSLRDWFTAGGQETIEVNSREYEGIPRIFFNLKNNLDEVIKCVKNLDPVEAKYFWKAEDDLEIDMLLTSWLDLVIGYAEKSLEDKKEFIVHLLGFCVGEENSSLRLKEKMAEYGLDYS